MTPHVRDRQPIYPPDLSGRPLSLTRERIMRVQPAALYRAWTQEWDRWFTTPGSVLMRAGVDEPFFFAVEFEGQVYPHYGRFLRLEPSRLVELTWLTQTTKGFETIVTVELAPHKAGTRLTLTHAGFPDEESMGQYDEGWRSVLEQQEQRLLGGS
jgi:uncharacterized protein YndB with AHSA1/START domain